MSETGLTIKQRVEQLFLKQHGQIVYTVGHMDRLDIRDPYCYYPGVIKSTPVDLTSVDIIAIRNMFLVEIISVTNPLWDEERGLYIGIVHTNFNLIAKTDYAGGPSIACKNYCYSHSFRRAFEYQMDNNGRISGNWATHTSEVSAENFKRSPCLVGNWSNHCLTHDTLLLMSAIEGTWYDIATNDSYIICGNRITIVDNLHDSRQYSIKRARFKSPEYGDIFSYNVYSILNGKGILIQKMNIITRNLVTDSVLLRSATQ